MVRWEYCQLEPTETRKGRYTYQAYQAFYSSQDRADNVEPGQERNEFPSWRAALNHLGNAGWEAFHIDAEGVWYFKQPAEEDDVDREVENTETGKVP